MCWATAGLTTTSCFKLKMSLGRTYHTGWAKKLIPDDFWRQLVGVGRGLNGREGRVKSGSTLDKSPLHHRVDKQPHTLTFTPVESLESPVNLTRYSLNSRRKEAGVPGGNPCKQEKTVSEQFQCTSTTVHSKISISFFLLLLFLNAMTGNHISRCETVISKCKHNWNDNKWKCFPPAV